MHRDTKLGRKGCLTSESKGLWFETIGWVDLCLWGWTRNKGSSTTLMVSVVSFDRIKSNLGDGSLGMTVGGYLG